MYKIYFLFIKILGLLYVYSQLCPVDFLHDLKTLLVQQNLF